MLSDFPPFAQRTQTRWKRIHRTPATKKNKGVVTNRKVRCARGMELYRREYKEEDPVVDK